jgi:hypothetical protein
LVYGDLKLAAALEGSLFAILTLFKTHSEVIYESHEACDLLRLNVDDATKNGGAHNDLIPFREHRKANNHVSQIPTTKTQKLQSDLQLQNSEGLDLFFDKAQEAAAGGTVQRLQFVQCFMSGARQRATRC